MTVEFDPERINELKAIGTHTLLRFSPEGLHRELFLSLRDEFDRQYYFKLLSSDNYNPITTGILNRKIEDLAERILFCEYAGHSESDGNTDIGDDQEGSGEGNPE